MQAPPYSCHVKLWLSRDWLTGARGAVGCRPGEAKGRGCWMPVAPDLGVLVLGCAILCNPNCPGPSLRNEESRLEADSSPDSVLFPYQGWLQAPEVGGFGLLFFCLENLCVSAHWPAKESVQSAMN